MKIVDDMVWLYKKYAAALAVAAVIGGIALAFVWYKHANQAKAIAALAAQVMDAPSIADPKNPITLAVMQSGANACAGRVEQVSNFLAKTGNVGAYIFPAGIDPDQHATSVSLEIVTPAGASLYGSESFVPNSAGGCDAVYETVEYAPQSCSAVAQQYFSAQKFVVLKKGVTLYEVGPVRYILMPAGSGCNVVKKEKVT